jgi:hypothetical protein
MRGLVLKCHVAATEGRADLVEQEVKGIKVMGGVALNHQIGGFNAEAIRISIKMGAKIIWMPTVSAENHIQHFGISSHMDALGGGMKGQGLTIYNKSGKFQKSIFEILELVKEADIILATGHLSPKESIGLVDEALRQGIKKILFTHPEGHMTRIPIKEQKRLAKRGVFFERCWVVTTDIAGKESRIPPEELSSAIKTIGPDSTVMATDHGQIQNPTPVEALTSYIESMLSHGITSKEIELMTKYNPSQLLGL